MVKAKQLPKQGRPVTPDEDVLIVRTSQSSSAPTGPARSSSRSRKPSLRFSMKEDNLTNDSPEGCAQAAPVASSTIADLPVTKIPKTTVLTKRDKAISKDVISVHAEEMPPSKGQPKRQRKTPAQALKRSKKDIAEVSSSSDSSSSDDSSEDEDADDMPPSKGQSKQERKILQASDRSSKKAKPEVISKDVINIDADEMSVSKSQPKRQGKSPAQAPKRFAKKDIAEVSSSLDSSSSDDSSEDEDADDMPPSKGQSKQQRKIPLQASDRSSKKDKPEVISSSDSSSSDESNEDGESEDKDSDGETITSSETRSKDSVKTGSSSDSDDSSSDDESDEAADGPVTQVERSTASSFQSAAATTSRGSSSASISPATTPVESTYLGYANQSHVHLIAVNTTCPLDGHSEMHDPTTNARVLLKNYPGTLLDKGCSYAVSFDSQGNGIGFIKVEIRADTPLVPFSRTLLEFADPPLKHISITGVVRYIGDVQECTKAHRALKYRSIEVWVMCADGQLEIVGLTLWQSNTHHKDLAINALLHFMGLSQATFMGKTRFNLGERSAIANVATVKSANKIKKKVTSSIGFDATKAAASMPKGFKIIK